MFNVRSLPSATSGPKQATALVAVRVGQRPRPRSVPALLC
jgi:hypothetical protein